MERRNFLRSALGPAATRLAQARKTLPRRRYRDDVQPIHHRLRRHGGGWPGADERRPHGRRGHRARCELFRCRAHIRRRRGRNQAWQRLVPYRQNVFLACKTTARDAAGAQKELDRSLERLHTDHFDLYQFHAVSSLSDVEQILGPGGAAEAFLKARAQGKARYLGCSAHSAEAALALMDGFQLDSILFPVNFVLYAQGAFGPQILARAKEKGVARLALKSLAYTKWPEGARKTYPKCWYQPVEQGDLARQALRFTLSEDVTAAIPPGDERLFQMALEQASEFEPLSAAERQKLCWPERSESHQSSERRRYSKAAPLS
jgi:predicted aldo/keto reductase-like oxidoreductase